MVFLFILFLPEGTAPYGGHLLAEAKGFHLREKEEEKNVFSSMFLVLSMCIETCIFKLLNINSLNKLLDALIGVRPIDSN